MMPVDSFAGALFWGSIPAIGIMIGTLSGVYLPLTHGMIARAMSFGAGMLLAAAAVELAAEVLHRQPYSGVTALLGGAALFSLANAWLSSRGAQHRKRCGECVSQPSEAERPDSGLAIAMGTAMDAVPEALVLGLVLPMNGPDAALIAAITLGNLPEAMSASVGMRAAQRKIVWIFSLWGGISVATAVLTGLGFLLADTLSTHAALLLQAFGAGALLSMVAETLLPEAAHDGPRYSGLVAALGFSLVLLLGVLAK